VVVPTSLWTANTARGSCPMTITTSWRCCAAYQRKDGESLSSSLEYVQRLAFPPDRSVGQPSSGSRRGSACWGIGPVTLVASWPG
jgi:hypothetical protein